MTERRRLGRVDGDRLDLSALDGAQHLGQAREVHRFGEAVADRLAHQHVVGDADRAGEVLAARGRVGEARREQIVRAHPLKLRCDLLAAAHPQDRERARRVPAPARGEHRRGEQRLRQRRFHAGRLDVLEHDLQRERVLVAQRQHQAVVGRGGLQLDVERAAELLAQRQAPRAVDARAERRVQDQLHAAGFVEEALGDDGLAGRHGAQDRFAGADVRDDLLRTRALDAALGQQPVDRGRVVALVDGRAQRGDFVRQLDRAAGALAVPERDRRRRAARVLHANHARFDAPDLPRRRAEQEDVARHAFHGEVFVHRADDVAVGFRDDVVVRGLGDRAARRDGRHARAAPRPQPAVDAVMVQERAAAPARGRDAVGQHRDDVVEVVAREVAVRIGRAHGAVQRVDIPFFFRGAERHELLREDVERRRGDHERVHRARTNAAHDRGAFDQFVTGGGEKPAFGLRADPVAGASDALQRRCDRARRAELHHEVDRADVDPELQRRRRDDRAQLALLEPVFRFEALVAREAAVVRQHDPLT